MYIDFHTHLGTSGPEPSNEELARAERLAQTHGIAKIVLLGNVTAQGGPNPTEADISDLNTHTLAVMDKLPQLFIGFCYLNPSHSEQFNLAEIERCVIKGGMKGIKLWIAVKATDTRLDHIMARAAALGVPVMHHAWYKQTSYSFQESTPAEIANLARRWPQVTIVMAHLSGCRERGVTDIAELPNVYIDTSGSQPDAGMVEYAVKRLGAERVLYGSDWCLRDFGTQLGRVQGASLSDTERNLILYGNARRLLHLSE
jgi:predicted TIM-barrel fold metal-dependent hydrolase